MCSYQFHPGCSASHIVPHLALNYKPSIIRYLLVVRGHFHSPRFWVFELILKTLGGIRELPRLLSSLVFGQKRGREGRQQARRLIIGANALLGMTGLLLLLGVSPRSRHPRHNHPRRSELIFSRIILIG